MIAEPMAALPFELSQQQWILIAGALVALVLILGVRRRGGPGSPREYRRELDSANAQGEGVRKDMETLLNELETLSRKINSQLDAKFAKLGESIAEADERIVALRTLIDATPQSVTETAEAISSSSGAAVPVGRPARTAPATPVVEDRHQAIYDLADEGLTAFDIAQRLGRRIGEIELILNLRAAQSHSMGP